MENYKVKVNNLDESKEVQELYIALGATCYLPTVTSKWVCLYNKRITFYDLLPNVDFKQVTIQHLRDLVVLKRNDVNDAKYVDSHLFKVYIDSDDKIYYFEQRQFNNGQYNTWVESCMNNHTPELLKDEYISELKPIEKEVKMKEFLSPEQGYALVECFVGETPIPSGWIEVPEGAEILYLNERYESANHFFKTGDGKSYYKYLNKDSEWREYSDEGLDDFKENIDDFRIMWQRNHISKVSGEWAKEYLRGCESLCERYPETPNTSIQGKLKFIEKWLNGEKIQYILGVESEKTQWHNFTEGAMQYIKRSDIKFRKAPKYVTINGIEFKTIESLLKHVKNNFDLEDGEVA